MTDNEVIYRFNYRWFNPNAFLLMKYLREPSVRFIVLYGGSSSAKSYSTAQVILLMTLLDGENSLIFRKVGSSIEKSIYEDFKVACAQMNFTEYFKFTKNTIRCLANGAKIDFTGLDDSEKIKGISNYKRVQLEEFSEFEESDFKQIRKRLRGKHGQQIIATFNPIRETHWIKKSWLDGERWHDVPMAVTIDGKRIPRELTEVKSLRMNEAKTILNPRTGEMTDHSPDIVLIQSTFMSNWWVVGSPGGDYGFYDEQCIADFEKDRIKDPDYYQVYALGEWGVIRTGSEFFASFNVGRHTTAVEYDANYPIHISVDNNVLPYISVTFWQCVGTDDIQQVRQFNEICAESPNNTVKRAAKLVAKYLKGLQYSDKLYLHGDASTRAANTIDDDKRSWLDLFTFTLEGEGFEIEDCVGNKNPSVAMTGEFINAIFEGNVPGIEIAIGSGCTTSIEDYLSVQKDVNGAILKTKVKNPTTKQTYEEHGHLSDTFRYVVADLLNQQFTLFSNRRRRNLYARDGLLRFYNPATEATADVSRRLLYVLPHINGKLCVLQGCKVGDHWRVVDVVYRDNTSTNEIRDEIARRESDLCIVECGEAYYQFVRALRQSVGMSVRVCEEEHDPARRIAATSDYVRDHVQFNETATNEDGDYSAFINDLLDYNADNSRDMEASVLLSGFVSYAVKI